jgi:hypothetical protein
MKKCLVIIGLCIIAVKAVVAQTTYLNWQIKQAPAANANATSLLLDSTNGTSYLLQQSSNATPIISIYNNAGVLQNTISIPADSFVSNSTVRAVAAMVLPAQGIMIVQQAQTAMQVRAYSNNGSLLWQRIHPVGGIGLFSAHYVHGSTIYFTVSDSTNYFYGDHFYPNIIKLNTANGNFLANYPLPDSSNTSAGMYYDEQPVAITVAADSTPWLWYAQSNGSASVQFRLLHLNSDLLSVKDTGLIYACNADVSGKLSAFKQADSTLYLAWVSCNQVNAMRIDTLMYQSFYNYNAQKDSAGMEAIYASIVGNKVMLCGNTFYAISGGNNKSAKVPYIVSLNAQTGLVNYAKTFYSQPANLPDLGVYGIKDAVACPTGNGALAFCNTKPVGNSLYTYLNYIDASGNIVWFDSLYAQAPSPYQLEADKNCKVYMKYTQLDQSANEVLEQYDNTLGFELALNSIQQSEGLQVWQNAQNIYVQNTAKEKVAVSMLDITGATVQTINLADGETFVIPTNNIASGLYIITNKKGYTSKILVR